MPNMLLQIKKHTDKEDIKNNNGHRSKLQTYQIQWREKNKINKTLDLLNDERNLFNRDNTIRQI